MPHKNVYSNLQAENSPTPYKSVISSRRMVDVSFRHISCVMLSMFPVYASRKCRPTDTWLYI